MKSVIIGAGTYGQVYLAYLKEAGVNVIGFIDDNPNEHSKVYDKVPVLGGREILPSLKETHSVECVYCPIGNNIVRVELLEYARELGYITPNFIHKDVIISPQVHIASEGVYILPKTLIMPYVNIDKDVMISVGANIIHQSTLKQVVFVSNGVNLGASLIAEKRAYIGMGATVMTGVKIVGQDCLIGAGAVVIKDVPNGAVMAGVPAKVIKYKDEYRQS